MENLAHEQEGQTLLGRHHMDGKEFAVPNIVRLFTGDDGLSHIEEVTLPFEPFHDTEGSHGEGTALQAAPA